MSGRGRGPRADYRDGPRRDERSGPRREYRDDRRGPPGGGYAGNKRGREEPPPEDPTRALIGRLLRLGEPQVGGGARRAAMHCCVAPAPH